MALGHAKTVPNLQRRHHAEAAEYLFVKVQHDYGHEEYWLLTASEVRLACENFNRYFPGTDTSRGVVALRMRPAAPPQPAVGYHATEVVIAGEPAQLAIRDLERIRRRVERNHEDIEANKENWLMDLLD